MGSSQLSVRLTFNSLGIILTNVLVTMHQIVRSVNKSQRLLIFFILILDEPTSS
jgi:hypothetical protein